MLRRNAVPDPLTAIDEVLDGTKRRADGDGFVFNRGEDGLYVLTPVHGSPRDMTGSTKLLGMVQRRVSRRKMAARLRITVSNWDSNLQSTGRTRGRETHFDFRNQHEFIEWVRRAGRGYSRDPSLRWCILVSSL